MAITRKTLFIISQHHGLYINVSAHCFRTTMDNLEKIYNDHFKDTFEKLGLEIYENSKGLMKFKNKVLRVQLFGDRGVVETDISPTFGQEEFRGIETYNSLVLLKNAQEKLSDLEKRRILGTRLDYSSQTTFMLSNFDRLEILLSKDNYKETLREIDKVGQTRNSY